MGMEEVFLSICIPSYNRFDRLKETLTNILKARSKKFEVCILDNNSDKNIYDDINIEDDRLKIRKQSEKVYGPRNLLDCLFYGTGKYVLLLLDKDNIKAEGLEAL